VIQPVTSGQVKVKPDSLPPVAPRKPVEPEIAPFTASDRFTTPSLGRPQSMEETGRAFPWRLAAVAIAVATVAILMGRTYLPGRTAVVGEPGAPVDAPTQEPASTPLSGKPETPIPAGRGRINIQTQPPGLRVLLDRKLVGETPLLVDAAPGRRVLTFMTSGGEVIHTVRVVAGKTVNLDIPVFSGWVSVIAPIVLNISEDGRSMGTTEQNRLMLPPGRHRLALSNPDFGYNSVHEVDVEPGAVRSITIDAKGTANLNAQPWAEVWLDGSKLGDTPLASAPVPLGLREFVFKHPELGERRVSATIRANTPTVVTVDFTK
jgi:PEGA domain